MENPYKLKVKIGTNEFEAEGSEDAVRSQFEAWKELIAMVASPKNSQQSLNATQTDGESGNNEENTPQNAPLSVDRIFRVEGRYISLTAPPTTDNDAALLILYGQKHYRSNEGVTGAEMMEGLTQSGIRVNRVVRVMDRLVTDGLVIRSGMHRGTRYRLTNLGLNRAQAIAREGLARVAQ